jgi:hypothetical protein
VAKRFVKRRKYGRFERPPFAARSRRLGRNRAPVRTAFTTFSATVRKHPADLDGFVGGLDFRLDGKPGPPLRENPASPLDRGLLSFRFAYALLPQIRDERRFRRPAILADALDCDVPVISAARSILCLAVSGSFSFGAAKNW